MNLTNITSIKALLSSHGLTLKKNLGQNFLINEHILEKIVATADIKPDDTILEIGAGIGTLTCKLAEKTSNVIAVEKDFTLIPLLRETLKEKQLQERVIILENDALRIDPPNTSYKIVANIPYLITSPLINHFLKDVTLRHSKGDIMPARPPLLMTLMVQKEVAEKITAREGKLNMLALNIQTFSDVKMLFHVKAGNFYPQPKVDSAVIQIKPLALPRVTCDLLNYFKIISAGFQSKRKNLANALSHNLSIPKETTENWIRSCQINPGARAETLTFQEWEKLTLYTSTRPASKE
ncbi:ribosomal RNA small subunit methyltransferase A [Candidatus Peregrinibacteria bacterium]|nr:ribosomal RNA small subunit methyltransferase A [Candidatus Peregrinibacteria bacterium]